MGLYTILWMKPQEQQRIRLVLPPVRQKTTAETANTTAGQAKTTAEAANTAAGKAQTTATDAKHKAELALDGAYDITYATNVLTFTKKSAE